MLKCPNFFQDTQNWLRNLWTNRQCQISTILRRFDGIRMGFSNGRKEKWGGGGNPLIFPKVPQSSLEIH